MKMEIKQFTQDQEVATKELDLIIMEKMMQMDSMALQRVVLNVHQHTNTLKDVY